MPEAGRRPELDTPCWRKQSTPQQERARKKAERQQQRRATLRESLWEKVEQALKDEWRPYHGSTVHREETDGNQLIEKKKSGGHMPLNAAVMARRAPGKLKDSREELEYQLYRLAAGSPLEVVCFSELLDLFGRYGASDSDLDELRHKATEYGPWSESAAKLRAVETGINLIVDRLIAGGWNNQSFWVDFPSPVNTKRNLTTVEKKQIRYNCYLDCRAELEAKGVSPITNKALIMAAERCNVTKQTIITAVQEMESGYIKDEAS